MSTPSPIRGSLAFVLLALLSSCTPSARDDEPGASAQSTASSTAGQRSASGRGDREVTAGSLPPREGSAEIARKLEEKLQRGELEGMYRPVGYDLVTLSADGKSTVEPLPEALHKHHEHVSDAWTAPDGTLFAVGFMYTGVPGPDTGVVYEKDADGPARIVYTKPENELGAVWGLSARDVYAVGAAPSFAATRAAPGRWSARPGQPR